MTLWGLWRHWDKPFEVTVVRNRRLDAPFEAERVIVELDSWRFHRGKIAFETDRERDADTLVRGFVTVRVTEERLDERPRDEAERLHAILAGRRAERHS